MQHHLHPAPQSHTILLLSYSCRGLFISTVCDALLSTTTTTTTTTAKQVLFFLPKQATQVNKKKRRPSCSVLHERREHPRSRRNGNATNKGPKRLKRDELQQQQVPTLPATLHVSCMASDVGSFVPVKVLQV